MEELLIKSLIISLVCVGLRMVSEKGMILYFLRLPYDACLKEKKSLKKFLKRLKKYVEKDNMSKEHVGPTKLITLKKLKKYNILIIILKPLIGCVTCMTSVYTPVIDWLYYGCCDKYTVLLIFMVACLNTLFYTLFEKLSK